MRPPPRRGCKALREASGANQAPDVRLQVLEPLRAALYMALRENAELDEFRTLPLQTAEVSPVWELFDAFGLLRDAYRSLIIPLADEPPLPGDDRPQLTALHRAIELQAQRLSLCLVLRLAVPVPEWEMLCRLGQTVRELDVHDITRPDPYQASYSQTCREAFVAPIYMALCDPAVLTRVEFKAVRAFARKFAPPPRAPRPS